ncbi:hypothetical protein [Bradyrhizobium sp. CSA207]|uniref:phage integrase central domain-containing protein n=1 Tax=Bradyrhizobium sp. CSA207 TaxID=2698826 RepID=UPI0023AEB12A|nr:hypothetical protein [Bradyrhizobium sp. CSA207]
MDIVQERRAARVEAKAAEIVADLPTFEECAETHIRANWSTWSEKHRDQWPSSLKRYAYPTIGKLSIPEIKPSHIHDLLKPIWVEKRETANRVRGPPRVSLPIVQGIGAISYSAYLLHPIVIDYIWKTKQHLPNHIPNFRRDHAWRIIGDLLPDRATVHSPGSQVHAV